MMPQERLDILKHKVLVVEGTDEQYFFEALLQDLTLPDIQVMPIGGVTKLPKNLKALSISPGFADVISLSIIRDADENPTGAFRSVCAALRGAKLPVPRRTLKSIGDRPKVSVMILPRDNQRGMLEDICLEAVAADPAMPCLAQYFECLGNQHLSLPASCSISKSRVQAFLASRQDTDMRLGIAAKKGYWPWRNPVFDQLKTFLGQM